MNKKNVDSSRVTLNRAWCRDCKRELVDAGEAAGFSAGFVHAVVCVPEWDERPWGSSG